MFLVIWNLNFSINKKQLAIVVYICRNYYLIKSSYLLLSP